MIFFYNNGPDVSKGPLKRGTKKENYLTKF